MGNILQPRFIVHSLYLFVCFSLLRCYFCSSTARPVAMEEGLPTKSYARALQTVSNLALRTDTATALQLGTVSEKQLDDASNEARTSKGISPWIHDIGNFRSNLTILKIDLILPKPFVEIVDIYLWLDVDDYTPVEVGGDIVCWVFLLVGFLGKMWL